MADAITIQALQDASLDAKTLEEVVNGNDAKQVTTRLGENYPSVKKAIKTLFENGGLPATPFKTKALMTASALANDKYAMVTDDTVNNGLYVKTAGAWVKSAYDPLLQSKVYTNGQTKTVSDALSAMLDQLNTDIKQDVSYITANNLAVKEVFTVGVGVTVPNTGSKCNRYDVKEGMVLFASGSTMSAINKLAFVDDKFLYISDYDVSNGAAIAVPKNAKYAYKNIEYKGEVESSSFTLRQVGSIDRVMAASISNNIFKDNPEGDLSFEIKTGAVANMTTDTNYPLLATGNNRAYLVADVAEYTHIKAGNTGNEPVEWRWLFVDASGKRTIVDRLDGGYVKIPDGAVKVYRSVYLVSGEIIYDSRNITIKARFAPTYLQNEILRTSDELEGVVSDVQLLKGENGLDAAKHISPNEFTGTTQTERIKKAVEFVKIQGFGTVELGYDTVEDTNVWVIDEAILLPSNCWIYINNSTVKQADGVFDNMFRNDGIVPSPDPFEPAVELNENVNIRIYGNDKKLSKIIGNRANPYTAPHPVNGGGAVEWVGDTFGWRAIKILFANTKGHRVYNLSVSGVTSWSISNEHGCSGYKYHDIIFDNAVKNGDGINNRMGCSDFEIYNISGKTSDDTIAVNTIPNFVTQHPSGIYNYPMQVGGYADRGFGTDIKNGKIWNIKGRGSNAGVLILYSGGGKVFNISVSDVGDYDYPFIYYAVRIGNTGRYGIPAELGDAKNITVRNVSSIRNGNVVELLSPLQDSWINGVTQYNTGSGDVVVYGADYVADNVKVTNVKKVTS